MADSQHTCASQSGPTQHSRLPWHTGPDTLVGPVWIYSECYPVCEPIGWFCRTRTAIRNAFFRLRGDSSPVTWRDSEQVGRDKYWAVMRANAAFIVRACNNHYQLLEACKEAAKVWEQGCVDRGWKDEPNWIDEAKDKLDAAITAAAEGGEE